MAGRVPKRRGLACGRAKTMLPRFQIATHRSPRTEERDCRVPCFRQEQRPYRNGLSSKIQARGTCDDEAALAPKASDYWPVFAHFSRESVPRAWKSAVSNRLPWVRLPERTTPLAVAFLGPTGLWYATWKSVPVWFTEAFWTRLG